MTLTPAPNPQAGREAHYQFVTFKHIPDARLVIEATRDSRVKESHPCLNLREAFARFQNSEVPGVLSIMQA
jgi:hypothetical protein